MKKSLFTNGNWEITRPSSTIHSITADGFVLANIFDDTCWLAGSGTPLNNARLLKSSKKMFEILSRILGEIELDEIPIKDRGKTYVEISQLIDYITQEPENDVIPVSNKTI